MRAREIIVLAAQLLSAQPPWRALAGATVMKIQVTTWNMTGLSLLLQTSSLMGARRRVHHPRTTRRRKQMRQRMTLREFRWGTRTRKKCKTLKQMLRFHQQLQPRKALRQRRTLTPAAKPTLRGAGSQGRSLHCL